MGFPIFSGVTLLILLLGPYYLIYNISSISEIAGTNPLLINSIFYSIGACFIKSLFLASIPIFAKDWMEYLDIITRIFYLYFIWLLIRSKNAKQQEVETRLNVCSLGWCIAHTSLTYFIPLITDSSLSSEFSFEYVRLILSSYSSSFSTFTCFYCIYMLTKPNLFNRKNVIILTIASNFLIQLILSGLFDIIKRKNIIPFINLPIFIYLSYYTYYIFEKKREVSKKR